MAELKTRMTQQSVEDFINAIPNQQIREDCRTLSAMMEKATHEKPKMWGESIVGFGQYHYRYASGREGDWMRIAFSPRKQNISIYVMGIADHYDELVEQLGKCTRGKGCLYIKNLAQINVPVLEKIIQTSVEYMRRTYPPV